MEYALPVSLRLDSADMDTRLLLPEVERVAVTTPVVDAATVLASATVVQPSRVTASSFSPERPLDA